MENYIPTAEMIVSHGIGIDDGKKIIEDFVKIGNGITQNMRAADLFRPDSAVLDVGCGLGRLARPLVDFLSSGEYHGIDIEKSSVDWCTQAYSCVENFHFHYADVYSSTYNTSAQGTDAAYRFPFAEDLFDFVWSTSLFTHMKVNGVDNYLHEMSRVMKPGAHCWNTFLLLDEFAEDAAKLADGSTRWYMPHRIEGGRVRDLDDWASQVALDQDRIEAIHDSAGLEIIDIRYGPWSGRTSNVRAGGQDVVIARKRQ